ncbi:hypothetical protein Tco_0593105 [Tanacetum coccineum]
MYFHHSIFLTPPLPFQTKFGRVRSEDFIVARMVKWAIRGLLTIGLYMAVEETLKALKVAFWPGLCGARSVWDLTYDTVKHFKGRQYAELQRHERSTEGNYWVWKLRLVDCVFKVLITTVKSIHHGCRFTFSQALKTVLCKVVAQPNYVDAWVGQIVGYVGECLVLGVIVEGRIICVLGIVLKGNENQCLANRKSLATKICRSSDFFNQIGFSSCLFADSLVNLLRPVRQKSQYFFLQVCKQIRIGTVLKFDFLRSTCACKWLLDELWRYGVGVTHGVKKTP